MKKYEKRLNYQPHSLSASDLENPETHLRMFFAVYPIHVIREKLWNLFRAWLFRCGEYADEVVITSMLQFYELLEEFLEVSYIRTMTAK